MSRITPHHRRFLVVDQAIGSVVVNLVLNGAIAWGMFRSAPTVPLWGLQASIAADTFATAFMLPVITSIIVGAAVRYQVRRGILPPLPVALPASWWVRRASWRCGAILGAVAIIAGAAPVVAYLAFAGPVEMRLWSFIWFKAAFAAALGLVVTPQLAWWALARASQEHGAAR